ncbi:MAG: hypothetical protein HZC29_09130 [Thaumarchaeota archaeon]|nr:hypothetical protein [Nitrososphaerota archaeon]
MKKLLVIPAILLLIVGFVSNSQAMTAEDVKERMDKIKQNREDQIKEAKKKILQQEESNIKSGKTKIKQLNATSTDISENNRNIMAKAELDTQQKIKKMKGLDEADNLKSENARLQKLIDALEKRLSALEALVKILNSTKANK